MRTFFYFAVSFVVMFSSCTSGDGWTDLFNGKDLTGFNQLNGKAPYRAEDGMLIGVSVKGQPSSFLATELDYSDFILEFDVLCDPALNSGVQFRSESRPDYDNGRVHGYQCEIDPSDRAWSGGIYDEARRGWLVTLQGYPLGNAAYKKGDWNHYRIEAFGDTIRIWLNGVNTANLLDNATSKGFIAFQIHSIGNNDAQDGKEIKWKNIRIMTDNIREHLMQGTLAPEVNRIPNVLSSKESAGGWKLLFDGKTNAGWRGAHKDAFPDKGWKIGDGMITVLRSGGGESAHGGDIVTIGEYAAFEFSLEFKITEGANSGIKYFVTEGEKQKGSAFGLEYQILDDRNHPDAKLYTTFPGSRACAGLYDLIAPRNIRFSGVGQWNLAVIKVFPNNHVEHWLNGFKTVEYERGSED
ncbi:MAG: DUF1080 domain-containing protein, partial [Tannerella sp.]|nr:DUF1080 domain-containing protein [Tannerella sp.]